LFPPSWALENSAIYGIANAPKIGHRIVETYVDSDLYLSSRSSNPGTPESETKRSLSDMVSEYGWNDKIAYKVMICESGGNPNAHNFSHITKDDSWGLFQINLYGNLAKTRPSAEYLKNPINNIEYAYKIYLSEGWGAWKNCL